MSHLHRVEGSHGHIAAVRLLLPQSASPLSSGLSLGFGPFLGLFTPLLGSLPLGFLLLLKLCGTGSSGLLLGNLSSLSGRFTLLSSFSSLLLQSKSPPSLGSCDLSLLSSGCETLLSELIGFFSCGPLLSCNHGCSLPSSSCFLSGDLLSATNRSGSGSGSCSSTCLSSGSPCSHVLSVPSPEHQSSSGSSSPTHSLLLGGSSTSGSKDSLVSGPSPGSCSSVGCVTSGDHPSMGNSSLSSEDKHSPVSSSTSEDGLAAGVCSTSSPNYPNSSEMGDSATMSNKSCPSNPGSP